MNKVKTFIASCALIATLSACGGSTVAAPAEPTVEDVENVEMTLSLTFWNDDSTTKNDTPTERTGTYSGEVIKGIPNGVGKFETTNSNGDVWYYEGEFKDGSFNGEGICTWPDNGYTEAGHYEDGLFVPTKTQFFDNMILTYSRNMFKSAVKLSDTTKTMIASNENIFPAITEEAKDQARKLMDPSIEYKHLTKSVGSYLDKLIYFKNQTVLQVEEFNYWGHTITRMFTQSADYSDSHYLFYDGSIDVFDGDVITFVSLPVSSTSFDNIGGGVTNTIVSVASIVIKN